MSVRYTCTYQCGEGVCMCTSMHVPCKSLRGSVSEGSLTSLVGQALTSSWEKGLVSKAHWRSSGFPKSKEVCSPF